MSKEFFEDFDIGKVPLGDMVVGKTYSLYGMITNIVEELSDYIIVEINFNAHVCINNPSDKNRTLLKERAFEPGIFIAEFKEVREDRPYLECGTVVFGKRHGGTS